uniref:Uncharacterized protein n=1 Tax=Rhizobium leguminosarum TaxID=384 RepID=A0A179BQ31_RHILE|nr:hypothetical protein A4U53_23335 [Rhizobium leguminosarum]
MLISIIWFGQRGPCGCKGRSLEMGLLRMRLHQVVLFSQGEYGENSITRLDGNIWILFCMYAKIRAWLI